MAGYDDLLSKGFELPFSFRLGQYLLGMGDVFGDVNKSMLGTAKLGQEGLEALERTRIAEDTLAERRREANLKQEEREWARQDRLSKMQQEALRRQAGEELYKTPRTMIDEVITPGQAPSLEEQETQPPSFFQQLSKIERQTTLPEALARLSPELRGVLTPENLAVAGKMYAEPKQPEDYTIGNVRFSGRTNKPIATVPAEPKDPTEQTRLTTIATAWLRQNNIPVTQENIDNAAIQLQQRGRVEVSAFQGQGDLRPAGAAPPGIGMPTFAGGPSAPTAPAVPSATQPVAPPAGAFDRNPDQRDPGIITLQRDSSVGQAALRDLGPNAPTRVQPTAPPATQPVTQPTTPGVSPTGGPRGETVIEQKTRLAEEAKRGAEKRDTIGDKADSYVMRDTGLPPTPDTPRYIVEKNGVSVNTQQSNQLKAARQGLGLIQEFEGKAGMFPEGPKDKSFLSALGGAFTGIKFGLEARVRAMSDPEFANLRTLFVQAVPTLARAAGEVGNLSKPEQDAIREGLSPYATREAFVAAVETYRRFLEKPFAASGIPVPGPLRRSGGGAPAPTGGGGLPPGVKVTRE